MNKKIFLTAVLVLTVTIALAKTGYYRLIVAANPSYEYTLGWIQINGENPVVWYDTQENYQKTGKLENKITNIKIVKYKRHKHAFARLTGLKPGTKYVVQITDNNSQSPVMWFLTIPTGENVRLSVIAGGDSRTRRKVRRLADKMVAKLQPHLVIFDGDFTTFSKPCEWKRWFKDWQLTIHNGRLIPVFVIPGNHETKNDVLTMFDLHQFPNGYYSVDIGDKFIHLVSLNTQYKIPGEQTQWFVRDLEQNRDATWTIVAYHKPMRPHYSKKPEGEEQYRNWAEPIHKNGVQLVLEGDTHTHKITYPVRPDANGDQGFVRDDSTGTVYVGEGCWGAPLRPADDLKSWTRDAASIDQFKWLWIDKNTIEIRTVEYHSVHNTQQLSPDNVFTVPQGIKLRQMQDGNTVVTIKNKKH